MAQLNQHLIVEIFLWLPVKSIKRFRCLSKSLCSAIDNPNFINWHLSRSSRNFNFRKLICSEESTNKFHVCDVDFEAEEDIIRLRKPVSSVRKEVFGYCNGLVLLNRSVAQRKSGCELWNPSTRQYSSNVPVYPFKLMDKVKIIGSGLGYDDSSNDYKAVFLVSYWKKRELHVQVWIYGLKSNTWKRTLDFSYLEYGINLGVGGPGIGYFADGSLHWSCKVFSNQWKSEIVAFDMRQESFSLVQQPICSINSLVPKSARYLNSSMKEVSTKLHVLEGCLCISYSCSSWNADGADQADLYMRNNKDGVGEFTWTKLFSVTETIFFDVPWFEIANVLGYSKRGDKIVLELVGLDNMVSYDVKDKTFRKVEVDKDPDWKCLILCHESLASVDW